MRITLAATAMMAVMATSAHALELRLLSSFPEGFVYNTDAVQPFLDILAEESAGSADINVTYSDAVPPLEQLEPVQAGVFDILFTHPAYHAGASSLGLAIDGIASDPTARRESGVFEFLDNHYQQLGLKVLAIPPIGGSQGAFSIYLKDKISGSPALEGLRLRGTVSYHPLFEALGASGVVMGGGEVYSSMQRGVIDGAAFSLGASQLRWFEVADYVTVPRFGEVSALVLMNLDAWNALPDDEQAMLERAAIRWEIDALTRFDALYDAEAQTLLDEGMETTAFPEAEAAQLNTLWANGVWELSGQADAELAAEFRRIAEGSGLTY